jgi:hypothetical protein
MSVIGRRAWISLGGSLCLAIALGSCGTLSVSSPDKKSGRTAVDASVVQSLQRQIKDREKRIAELEAQLDALKVIDQSTEKLRKPIRPPATLPPVD